LDQQLSESNNDVWDTGMSGKQLKKREVNISKYKLNNNEKKGTE